MFSTIVRIAGLIAGINHITLLSDVIFDLRVSNACFVTPLFQSFDPRLIITY